MTNTWIDQIRWSNEGLVPAIAQDLDTGRILMMAWMNRESLQKTVELRQAVYWSRSRQQLWYKGEESGHIQDIHEICLDCDDDVLLLKISQQGGIACHTGRESCFYRVYNNGRWEIQDAVLKNPTEIYAK